jgi:hypothetical protein
LARKCSSGVQAQRWVLLESGRPLIVRLTPRSPLTIPQSMSPQPAFAAAAGRDAELHADSASCHASPWRPRISSARSRWPRSCLPALADGRDSRRIGSRRSRRRLRLLRTRFRHRRHRWRRRDRRLARIRWRTARSDLRWGFGWRGLLLPRHLDLRGRMGAGPAKSIGHARRRLAALESQTACKRRGGRTCALCEACTAAASIRPSPCRRSPAEWASA